MQALVELEKRKACLQSKSVAAFTFSKTPRDRSRLLPQSSASATRITMFSLGLFIALSALALASPTQNRNLHNSKTSLSRRSQLEVGDHLSTAESVTVHIALRQQHIEDAEKLLMAVSDPDSPDYGKHWSRQDVQAYFAPKNTSFQAVDEWLRDTGVGQAQILRARYDISVRMTASDAEDLLQTRLTRASSEDAIHQSATYNLPEGLEDHIDYIAIATAGLRATSKHAEMRLSRVTSTWDSAKLAPNQTIPCDQLVTPNCLRDMYGIPTDAPTHPNNGLSLVFFSWAAYREPDLDEFLKNFGKDLVGKRPVDVSVSGGMRQIFANASHFNNEANLDTQYAMVLARPSKLINYQVGDMHIGGNLNTFLAAVDGSYCNAIDLQFDPKYPNPAPATPPLPAGYNATDCGTIEELPKVMSVSYAWQEDFYSEAYMRRQCLEYLKLGLQGTTIIFGSGDYGVGGHPAAENTTCGLVGESSDREKKATFPCSCPWVTCVGGTQLDGETEVAFNRTIMLADGANVTHQWRGSSAGGYSKVFEKPWYQAGHVNGLRGFPDLSANADAHVFVSNDKLRKIYGVSAAAPVFAAIVSRLNDARMLAGKSSLGFINPVLYKRSVLRDITNGSNYACDGSVGYETAEGWDAVTGMGAPDYGRMLDTFMELP